MQSRHCPGQRSSALGLPSFTLCYFGDRNRTRKTDKAHQEPFIRRTILAGIRTMKIKHPLFSIPAALCLLLSASSFADTRQYYELRVYATKSAEQQQRVINYWQNAAVPAYNRLGIQPIGVFTEIDDSPTNSIYVLLPSDSFEAFGEIPIKLAADAVYQKAAADFLNAPKTKAAS